MADVYLIIVALIAIVITGAAAVQARAVAARRRRARVPVSQYQSHRDKWVTSGDLKELDRMVEEWVRENPEGK